MSTEHLSFIATVPPTYIVTLLTIQIISAKARDKAFNREWEEIGGHIFKITKDITIIFKGRLCNIKNGKGKLVKALGIKNGQVIKEVFAGYKCYIIQAQIKLEKR